MGKATTSEADVWRAYARKLELLLASIGHLAADLPDRPVNSE
jgi:hypothetical protein